MENIKINEFGEYEDLDESFSISLEDGNNAHAGKRIV